MKKISIFGIAAALMMGTVALSSCSNDELPVENEAQIAKNGAKTYSFSVQAVMDNEAGTRVFDEIGESTISSKFDENEAVYVFIEKENGNIAYGCDKDDNTKMALYPTDVSADGASCKIVTDNLTFIPKSSTFEVEVGDKVYLYYGMTVDTNSNPLEGYFNFTTAGSKDIAQKMDYNKAEMVITGVDDEGKLTLVQKEDETKTNFSFTNINSIFRQKLTIRDENGDEINDYSTIKKVVISSASNKTVKHYYPFGNEAYEYGPIVIDNPDLTDGNIYFSTIFSGGGENDAITFTAYDADGKTYRYTKDAPDGGFVNNMYYYGENPTELAWISNDTEPIIVNYNEDSGFPYYEIWDDPANFSLSGDRQDNVFMLINGGTVTLDNINATIFADSQPFMMVGNDYNGLTLNLKGASYITMNSGASAFVSMGAAVLKLRCEGESATLTIFSITNPVNNYSGFQAFDNIDFANTGGQGISSGTSAIDETDPENYNKLQEIAADDNNDGNPDYTVERSKMTTVDVNGVTLYEWTFTVSKINP